MSLWSKAKYTLLGAALGSAAVAAGRMSSKQEDAPCIHVIQMSGNISPPAAPGGWAAPSSGINLAGFEKQLSQAFEAKSTKAIVIELNSPGGSPAQSSLLHSRIRALRQKRQDIPVLCFCTDMCASGGYYIAVACDEIHVLPSTLIGSIGVVSPGVGLVDCLKKLGVEDRTLTSGHSKMGDNPLQPSDPVAVAKKRVILEDIHADFIAKVKQGRADKLDFEAAAELAKSAGDNRPEAGLLDGSVFAGTTGVRLGLADGLYDDMEQELQKRFGDDIKLVRKQPSGFQRLFGDTVGALGGVGADAMVHAVGREVTAVLGSFR
eukprot:TRINITY_DN37217_c0_g1_i1.p1 TRINITY_DN37217_c0_g1~~TRINITY_DN37217_c0_g1_i1.p1  ORF type:complete len:320 (+),score=77.06 TRINITY_DN37217_c0_g1_i1:174-1133(+)